MNYYSDNYLMHHGVKGMKWGVWNEDTARKYKAGQKRVKRPEELGYAKIYDGRTGKLDQRALANSKINKDDEKWLNKVSSLDTHVGVYNAAADTANKYLVDWFNKKYADVDWNDAEQEAKALRKYSDMFEDVLNSVGDYSVYHSPSGQYMIRYTYDANTDVLGSIDAYYRANNGRR